MNKINSLTGIKALATIVILLYHYNNFSVELGAEPYFSTLRIVYVYGHWLVDLFFIISGFLFFEVYASKIQKGELSFSIFIKKRLISLWPLFLISTICTYILQWVLFYKYGEYFRHTADLTSLYLNCIGLSNVGIYTLGGNGPAWYLSVLLVMYVIYFFVVKLLVPVFRDFTPLLVFALSLILFLNHFHIPFFTEQVARGELGFSVGWFVYKIYHSENHKKFVLLSFLILVGTSVMSIVFAEKISQFYGNMYLYWCCVVFPCILVVVTMNPLLFKFFSNPVLLFLGKISYSLYLWHFPINLGIYLFAKLLGRHIIYENNTKVFWFRLFVTAVTSLISYFILEKHIIKKLQVHLNKELTRGGYK